MPQPHHSCVLLFIHQPIDLHTNCITWSNREHFRVRLEKSQGGATGFSSGVKAGKLGFRAMTRSWVWQGMPSGNLKQVLKCVLVQMWVSKRFLFWCLHSQSSRQGTRVCRCEKSCLSILESRISEISNLELSWIGFMNAGSKCETPGALHGDCPGVSGWLNGCQVVQGFHMVQGICQRASWKFGSYGIIEPWWMLGYQSWIPEPEFIGNWKGLGISIELWQCAAKVAGVAHQGWWQNFVCMQRQGHVQGEQWCLGDNPCWERRV